ncbi:beta-galactosidase GalB [Pedobacter gandavensis]|uniref:DUF4982 domain-containing protein n=1 Tax=Pedobacter gandavensis TaxID=2679963 RepID=A0ABR6EQE2_9SPHI|nr:beta-galactosidase GalB [Pedobacter gandavensis]MBB2147450.1 DUF4982 domain-containing protein [Pedobacter gandavensis]
MNCKKIYFRLASLVVILTTIGVREISAQNKSITRMGSMNTLSFDQGWSFARYGLQPDGTRKEEPSGLEVSSFHDSGWQKLNLPHDWAISGPFRIELEGSTGKLPWKGIGWYRKHFTVHQADAGKRVFVDFDGAMANAKIWLNGKYVGTWPYGYSSFRMDLTPFLEFGKENVLAVRLDTEDWDSRWYPGAGIYRHVWLVKTDPVHVGHWGTYITTPQVSDQKAVVNIVTTVNNQSLKDEKAIVRTTLYELDKLDKPSLQVGVTKDISIDINAGENKGVSSKAILLKPKLWSIETPHRYVAKTTIHINGKVVDSYFTPFGVRTIEFTAKNGFLLNGKRVQIQGTCNHHDLGALGAAFNLSALTRQLKLLKDMGCNSLRTSHNPPAPELLEMADKMGFLVWDEAFDAWEKGKRKNDYNKIFDEWHDKDLTALVHRDRNHPSVFIWSIGNEVMEQQNAELTKHLVDIVHRKDPTRPVSNGYNDPDGGRSSGAVVALDLMGVNYFFGQQARWDADPRYANKPTLGSETSSCVSTRGTYYFGGTEYKNWQITSYDTASPGWGCAPDEQFRTNAKYPNLLGEYVWTGFDYLGEPTPYNSDETNLLNFRTDASKKEDLEKQLAAIRKNNPPSRSSYFGIIDLAGFPKDRFYSYQAQWRPNLPMAHILPHWNWPERLDSITPVHVYTSGDEAELFLNGKSLGRKAKTPGKDFRLVWDKVIYQPGVLKVLSYKKGKLWATDVVKTTGAMAKLALSSDRTSTKADKDDLCFITLKVTDKAGLMVPGSNPDIHFSIEGPGEIVATDNGDATSFVSFQSHERPAFNGMALLIVKPKKGAKGMITIKAQSDGLATGFTKIQVQ